MSYKKRILLKVILGTILSACLLAALVIMPVSAAETTLPSGIHCSDIEKVFDDYYKENQSQTAGTAIEIFNSKGDVFQKCYGYSDIKNKTLVDNQTVFDWGSVTKTTVWVSVLQLKEQGKIDLDTDIKEYLPPDFFSKIKYDTPITMRMLMNHTAGWQECLELWVENKDDIKPLGEALQDAEPEQIFKPGTVQAYSNYGAAVAGYVVECITGKPFYEYVNMNIFEPLGLKHTSIAPDFSDNPQIGEKRLQLKCYSTDNQLLGNGFSYLSLYPAGSIVGTIEDFATYGKAFFPEAGSITPLFKSNHTLKELLSPSYYIYGTNIPGCYHGFFMLNGKNQILFHNGGTAGCTSFLGFDPTAGIGYAVLTNQCDNNIYASNSITKVFGSSANEASNNDSTFTKNSIPKKISGIYLNTRTVTKGHYKIYSTLFSLVRLYSKENGDLYLRSLLLPFGGTHLKKISGTAYTSDMMPGLNISLTENANGTICLHLPSNDYIKINSTLGYLQVILLYLFAFSILFAAFSLIADIVCFLINRIKKKKANLSSINIEKAFLNLMILLNTLNILSELNDPNKVPVWQFLFSGICALIPIAYTLHLIIKLKTMKCTTKHKIVYILTSVTGIIFTINIVYWEMYKFW
ncbi:serine hydrolase domain-containing protein [Anaerocolumna sp. MB42-C2]|uniref:serine hydrolase domain-containing protein n=1 Tax=Anaerocolumna sp. MB42-C2 TaxID=3070997 RepID=UPI0027E19CDB|nr:serine hydrolase domain-containing protein [Anaerocolumna sp. MB42-C2]WMJ89131.1 serine hydrolase domain-containing protein [Anaerocolumna sp. MB42-C2]